MSQDRITRGASLEAALEALPLFPLPQTVLFPECLLPLHVFEPRYRAMTKDAIETHRCIAVVLVTDATAVDDHGHPAIASVAGVGEIIDHTELPGGRYDILLRGRARVRLAELPFVPPYRRARATVLHSIATPVSSSDRAALSSSAAGFAARVRERDESFELRIPRDAPVGVVADLCAQHLIVDARERQRCLETLDEAERVRRVIEALAVQSVELGGRRGVMN